jgi:hypothetical protein
VIPREVYHADGEKYQPGSVGIGENAGFCAAWSGRGGFSLIHY